MELRPREPPSLRTMNHLPLLPDAPTTPDWPGAGVVGLCGRIVVIIVDDVIGGMVLGTYKKKDIVFK